jgi:uncharacterized DUF497 family protein
MSPGARRMRGDSTRVLRSGAEAGLDVVTICSYTPVVPVRLEWAESKRRENLRKHGIDFIDVESLFEGFTATLDDDRFDYSERRFISFGILEGRTVAVAHTERDGVIRIISVRKATRREEASYFSTIAE